jgi:hypothetical protein
MIFAIPIAVPSPSAASFSVPISTSFRARPLYTLPRFATYRKHMSSCRQLRYTFLPIAQSVVSPSSYSPFCSSRTPLPTSCRWLRLQCLSLPIQPRLQGYRFFRVWVFSRPFGNFSSTNVSKCSCRFQIQELAQDLGTYPPITEPE